MRSQDLVIQLPLINCNAPCLMQAIQCHEMCVFDSCLTALHTFTCSQSFSWAKPNVLEPANVVITCGAMLRE